MVTRADTLAHLVDVGDSNPDDPPHNPLLPLNIGDIPGNKYLNITYDQLSGTAKFLAINGISSSVLTFDDDGTILINGLPISDDENLQAILAACQLAAQQAAASATAAGLSATAADNSADIAVDASQTSQGSAILAQQYAQADATIPLPGGGYSAAVNAQIAGQIAQLSRNLDLSDPVTASETYESGFFNTERRVTTTSAIEITLPPGLYSSSEKQSKWGAYKLCAASGSVKAVASSDVTGFITPTILKSQHTQFRVSPAGDLIRNTLSTTLVSVQAVVSGLVIFIINGMFQADKTPSINVSCTLAGTAGTISPIRAFPTDLTISGLPYQGAYSVPLTSFAGGNIVVSSDLGPYVHYQSIDVWVIENHGGTPLEAHTPASSAGVSQVSVTINSLAAQALVLTSAQQAARNSTAGMGFSSFSTNLTPTLFGITYGTDNIGSGDDDFRKNTSWVYGSGVVTAAGNFTGVANFNLATQRAAMIMVAIPPKAGGGGGTAVLKLEGDRDTLTVPYGTMEIWAQPDGVTYEIKTSKP